MIKYAKFHSISGCDPYWCSIQEDLHRFTLFQSALMILGVQVYGLFMPLSSTFLIHQNILLDILCPEFYLCNMTCSKVWTFGALWIKVDCPELL